MRILDVTSEFRATFPAHCPVDGAPVRLGYLPLEIAGWEGDTEHDGELRCSHFRKLKGLCGGRCVFDWER